MFTTEKQKASKKVKEFLVELREDLKVYNISLRRFAKESGISRSNFYWWDKNDSAITLETYYHIKSTLKRLKKSNNK